MTAALLLAWLAVVILALADRSMRAARSIALRAVDLAEQSRVRCAEHVAMAYRDGFSAGVRVGSSVMTDRDIETVNFATCMMLEETRDPGARARWV